MCMTSSTGGRGRHVERCTFCEKRRHHVASLIAGPPGGLHLQRVHRDLQLDPPGGAAPLHLRRSARCPPLGTAACARQTLGRPKVERLPDADRDRRAISTSTSSARSAPRRCSRSRSTTTTTACAHVTQAGADQRRRRDREDEHPARRADRLGQDAARAHARAHARRALRDRGRDDADRGRLRRRGRREHPAEAAAELRLRRRARAAGHRLHRRDRQDRPHDGQRLDHARRVRRGRAAGAAEDPRGHRRERPAAGRAQASRAGLHPGRHDQHPVHLRRDVQRHRGDHRAPRRPRRDRLRARCADAGSAQEAVPASGFGRQVARPAPPAQPAGRARRVHASPRAAGPDRVRDDPGVRRPPARGRDARHAGSRGHSSAS